MKDPFFIERRFGLGAGEVIARFQQPRSEPTGEFRCDWTLDWPNRRQARHVFGIDGVQALMHAMRSVHTELVESPEYASGALTFLEQRDLDLPPTWGVGPLYSFRPPKLEDEPPSGGA